MPTITYWPASTAATTTPSKVTYFPTASGSTGTATYFPGSAVASDGIFWAYSSGLYLPSNNMDAASCYAVAIATATGLPISSGGAILPFTVAGGAPTLGQTVWLASSQDDTNTGRGKCTATIPSLSIPVVPLFAQNIVPVGTVSSTVNLGSGGAPKYTVTLAGTIAPTYTPVVDSTAVLNGTTCPTYAVDSFTTNGAAAQCKLANNETVAGLFYIDRCAYSATANVKWAYLILDGSSNGLGFGLGNNGFSSYIYTGGLGIVGGPKVNVGLNSFRLWRAGGLVHIEVNGQTATTMSDAGTDASAGAITQYMNLGYANILGLAKFTDVHAAPVRDYTPILTPFQLLDAYVADSHCQWYIPFSGTATKAAYTSGTLSTTAGSAGSSYSFTTNGSPTVVSTTLNWNRNPTSLFIDGPVPVYDSRHYTITRPCMGIKMSLPISLTGLVNVGYSGMDQDNQDEDDVTRYDRPVSGAEVATSVVSSVSADGAIHYAPPTTYLESDGDPMTTWAGYFGSPAVGVDATLETTIRVSDQVRRIDTASSGTFIGSIVYPSTATFSTETTTNRLVMIGDGVTIGGHGADALAQSAGSGSVISRIRSDYPGRVSAISAVATQSIAQMKAWGNGSVVPFARYIYDSAQRGGAPATIVYCATLGLYDWNEASPLATFGTDLALFLSTLHGLDSGKTFKLAKSPQTHIYSTANTNGDHLQAYVDLVIAQSGWSLIDVTTPNDLTGLWVGSPTALSPSVTAGQIALKGNYKTRIGY